MLKTKLSIGNKQIGFSLLEVLVTIIILAFGLLGLAGLQGKMQLAEFESYQRAQAILLLKDITERINLNRSQVSSFLNQGAIGTGDSQLSVCGGSPGPARSICEWSNALKGASEQISAVNVGAMSGARGCITQLQAPNLTPGGVCTPGIYFVEVAWQGFQHTTIPNSLCGQGLYGADDAYRRVISSKVTIGSLSC